MNKNWILYGHVSSYATPMPCSTSRWSTSPTSSTSTSSSAKESMFSLGITALTVAPQVIHPQNIWREISRRCSNISDKRWSWEVRLVFMAVPLEVSRRAFFPIKCLWQSLIDHSATYLQWLAGNTMDVLPTTSWKSALAAGKLRMTSTF